MTAPGPGKSEVPPADARPLLAQRDFAALWWGQLISILGDRLHYLALGGLLLAHTGGRFEDAHHSSMLLGLLGYAMLAPVLMFAPFVGPLVDRWNLRRTLILSDTVRGLLVFAIPPIYAATQHVGPVLGIVFLLFTCNVFFLPAKSAMTPEIVPPSQLLAANTLLSVAGIVATAVGALVGGWIVDHWGWQVALSIDACTYLVSVVSLALVRYRQHPRPAAPAITLRGYLGEIGEGLQVVRRSAPVGLALTALGAVWLGGGFLQVAGNLHIQRAASIPGMERIGVLMTVVGLGMGLGTWWVNTRARRLPSAAVLGGGLLVAAGALVAFAVSTRFAVFAGAGFLAGIGLAPAFVLTETLLQQGTDLAARGRVFSLRDFSMRLGFQVAILAATLLTPRLGTTFAMLVAAGLMTLAGLSSLAWGPRLRAEGAVPRP